MYVSYRTDVRGGCTECGRLCVTELTLEALVLSVDVCVLQS